MRKILMYFSLITFFITLSFCKKDQYDNTTIIRGTVKDFFSKEYYKNLYLKIYQTDDSLIKKHIFHPIDSIRVDEIGSFDFTTDKLKFGNEYILFYADDSLMVGCTYILNIGSNNEITLFLKRLMNLNIQITNHENIFDKMYLDISFRPRCDWSGSPDFIHTEFYSISDYHYVFENFSGTKLITVNVLPNEQLNIGYILSNSNSWTIDDVSMSKYIDRNNHSTMFITF